MPRYDLSRNGRLPVPEPEYLRVYWRSPGETPNIEVGYEYMRGDRTSEDERGYRYADFSMNDIGRYLTPTQTLYYTISSYYNPMSGYITDYDVFVRDGRYVFYVN